MRKGQAVGLLGGSFNPAHGGHRHISLQAMRRLKLDEIWWLVSPQNPLKPVAGMAPFAARLESARRVARHPRLRVSGIEAALDTTLTVDTIAALKARHPQVRFVWLMGADNLLQFHRWVAWRAIAAMVPIVVLDRPGYSGRRHAAPALSWLRRFRHPTPAGWRSWSLPAFVTLNLGYDPRSATQIRQIMPRWAEETPA
ncbi:nicotinate-nucleotide adenylyltransferase [Sandaracinobacteroides saxicola]|uniref:Probable nicotinate-nucleotide adenylyltransferase n=1 Tax=Sandaracinobacteroides saxicola TaxID=2759707 RepID=A0A7G5IHP4_9SPHN|nr:nicotinate-nucleotide adenylyltransferase [Sandaracinobacteroides saxicola]QMW22886.1 nicotinate-nucleotide adenylyltransferase [Sandaracinobacteroides saxicola]